MKNSFKVFSPIFFLFVWAGLLLAQSDLAVTVTNSNVALINERRSITLKKGIHTVNLTDIPSGIQPTSVLIESMDRAFNVLEQNYEYDLISVSKMLNKSIDQQILLVHPDLGKISGKLLSADSKYLMLLDHEDNLQIVPKSNNLKVALNGYSKRKTRFITRPTLVWKVEALKQGSHPAQLSYLTDGLNWHADYVGKLNEQDSKITLAGWVSITNNSGKTFRRARLKLMAGELNMPKQPRRLRNELSAFYASAPAAKKAFKEKGFFEYHLYSLQRKTDLGNNQIKQIQLFPETKSPVKKIYRVDSRLGVKVHVLITLKNSKQNNLGFALPAGPIRLYKADGKDLEFIGGDYIEHTPKDEKLEIKVGKAFDIVAERNMLKSERPSKNVRKEKIQYKIRNHKKEDVVVQVIQRLNAYQENELLHSNFKVIEKKADAFKFAVPVKANGESVLEYEYMTSW